MGELTSLRIVSGALVWALHFTGSYGTVALLCARGAGVTRVLGMSATTLAMTAMTAVALAALALIALRSLRGRATFADWMAVGVAALAAIAIAWEALLVMQSSPCV